MAELDVECPTGLTGRVRGMKGGDFRHLDNKAGMESGESLTRVLEGCWLETKDLGHVYQDKLKWPEMLLGDRFYLLIQIRRATYPGELYSVDLTCESKTCRRIEWSLDLNDLEVRALPEATIEALRNGEKVFKTSAGGKEIGFGLQTGLTMIRQKKMVDELGPEAHGLLLSLAGRIETIDGEGKLKARRIFDFLYDLGMEEHRDLLEEFERVDCGVNTEIEVECPWCHLTQKASLPFGRAFFMPRKKALQRPTAG